MYSRNKKNLERGTIVFFLFFMKNLSLILLLEAFAFMLDSDNEYVA